MNFKPAGCARLGPHASVDRDDAFAADVGQIDARGNDDLRQPIPIAQQKEPPPPPP